MWKNRKKSPVTDIATSEKKKTKPTLKTNFKRIMWVKVYSRRHFNPVIRVYQLDNQEDKVTQLF